MLDYISSGDLLFYKKYCAEGFEGAVCAVAEGEYSHVAIVISHDEIVHALQRGIVQLSLAESLAEIECDLVEVCRLPVDEDTKKCACDFAKSVIGCEYNDVFSPNCLNSSNHYSLYCSQLIEKSYSTFKFPEHHLSFRDKDDNLVPYWVEYFEERRVAIPEAEPGSHPAQIRRAKGIEMKLSRALSSVFRIPTSISEPLNFVDGSRIQLRGQQFVVIEPRSGKELCRASSASAEDVDEVVAKAKHAQMSWRRANDFYSKRFDVLRKVAELIRENSDEIAHWETIDNGKPLYEAKMDVEGTVETFLFYSSIARSLAGRHYPLDQDRYAYTTREPIGVVACIGAWNYPFQTCAWKIAPALAAGNAVVYKPSPLTPVTAVILADIMKAAGLPDGLFNVIQGDGLVGKRLIESTSVNKVSFTGSVDTGKKIMKACAERNIKPITAELGGKSSLIICADADVNTAVTCAILANFFSQGQVCTNASKVFVHRSIVEQFSKDLILRTKSMVVGDPLNMSTKVGAHISREHLEKVKTYIEGAVKEGARILYGGERVTVEGLNGFYLSPCILADVTPKMTVYREEIFGSVLLLMPFNDEETVINLANDSNMRLAAGVCTSSLATAHRISEQLQAGTVYINTYNDTSAMVPFGGVDQAGFGRENGTAAIESYTQLKSTFVNTARL